MRKKIFQCSAFLIFVLLLCSSAQAVTALIAEVKKGKGVVEFKAPGQAEWKPVLPLQSIENGSVLRATNDSFAVILYASSGRTAKISAANSPYKVQEIKIKDDSAQKAQKIFQDAVVFLAGKKTEMFSAPMSVRGKTNTIAIISPKDTKILTGKPVFEWIGPSRVLYRIIIKQGSSVIWSQDALHRTIIVYPSEAKPLEPGVRYVWLIESQGYPSVESSFTISQEQEQIQSLLEVAQKKAAGESTKTSTAVLQYGVLASQGFYADARRVLLDAVSADPDAPSLHFLLGDCYKKLGLQTLADEEFDEAQFLMQINP